jgi:hypothetical protein
MKPLAAIWHYTDPATKSTVTYPVAIVAIFFNPAQAFGISFPCAVVDTSGRLRHVPANELEVISQDATDALAEGQRRLST